MRRQIIFINIVDNLGVSAGLVARKLAYRRSLVDRYVGDAGAVAPG